ncbi:hypothetical protein [Hymenobacter pini]|uniref:hypothetical protein n=1 Tax=Hymenobacter pini TaxID=2880879 RepID=UPI001CF3533C|nr:hypothetical protein [Hymenobacter pini]MCA8832430.1 hypothetical protein [Hymenobacter pini]
MPTLRIYGHEQLNLPTAFVHFVPFVNNIRCPTRWVLFISLLLPLVAFSHLEAGGFGRWRSKWQWALALGLTAGVLVEYWPAPYQRATAADVPAVYRYVAGLPGTTLITVPFGIGDGSRQLGQMPSEQLFYQQWHHKKLLGGYLSRVRPEFFTAVAEQPFLHTLLTLQAHPGSVPTAPLPAAQVRAFLRHYQPAAFVVPPRYRQQAVGQWLLRTLQSQGYQARTVDGYLVLQPARPE